MMAPVQLLQALARHVRVDLRRRYIGVTEEHLHDAQIGAVIQEMGGKSMAQHVR